MVVGLTLVGYAMLEEGGFPTALQRTVDYHGPFGAFGRALIKWDRPQLHNLFHARSLSVTRHGRARRRLRSRWS
jgi:hypothetical protein